MNKNIFKKKFPDIAVQTLTTMYVLSRAEIEKTVLQMCNSMQTGLVYYSCSGRTITAYTSDKMRVELEKMVSGHQLTDPRTGKIATVVSEHPYVMCGSMCVTVDFGTGAESYDCEYFIQED